MIDENYHVRKMSLGNTIVFSHGAPILPQCKRFVLHINNALPFVTERVNLGFVLRKKMSVLCRRLFRSAEQADLVTVESNSTLDLLEATWGTAISRKSAILGNGVDPVSQLVKVPWELPAQFSLAIGTYPYKRIERVIDIAKQLSVGNPHSKLLIVGPISKKLSEDDFILNYPNVPYPLMRELLQRCDRYISMSQIENSSIAMLEAIFSKKNVVCSDIPSHLESLAKAGYRISREDGILYAELDASNYSQPPSWLSIAEQTMELLKRTS